MTARYVLRHLFDPLAPETAGQRVQLFMFEVVVCARALYEQWAWATMIPSQPAITHPTGVGRYLDVSFMLRDALYPQLNALLCAFCLLLGVTRRFRGAYALAFLLLSVQYAARYGLGKVQHGANMIGVAVLALAIAHLAFAREDLRRKATVGLLVAMISVGYVSAATMKLRKSGIEWIHGEHLWLWIHEKRLDSISAGARGKLNFLQEWALSDVRLATAMLSFGLLSELSAVFMWWRPLRRWVMLSLAAMHIGIAQVMRIYFTPSVLILLSLALPIAEVFDFLRARHARGAPRTGPGTLPPP